MKKNTFITIFIAIHVVFIFLQIHKYSQIIKQSYQKQKNELQKNELIQKKQLLTHQLYAMKNRSIVKKFAQESLNMHPINLSQIKKLNKHG